MAPVSHLIWQMVFSPNCRFTLGNNLLTLMPWTVPPLFVLLIRLPFCHSMQSREIIFFLFCSPDHGLVQGDNILMLNIFFIGKHIFYCLHIMNVIDTRRRRKQFCLFTLSNLSLDYPYWVNPSKRGGMDGISEGWQGCYEGFPEDKAWGKSWGAALPARGKPRQSLLLGFTFYL